MRAKVVLEDASARKDGANIWTIKKYSPAHPRTKLWNKHLWVGGSCQGKRIELKLISKTWTRKKLHLQVFLITC
jgi:hypothetical protein